MTPTEKIITMFALDDFKLTPTKPNPRGRNTAYIGINSAGERRVLRLSETGDRDYESYLAETEYVRYLAENGASVADVIASVNRNFVERIEDNGKTVYASLFEYAEGDFIFEHNYRYIEGAPITDYYYETGKTLGKIHELSKKYTPLHRRGDFFDYYSDAYIDTLISDEYGDLKRRIFEIFAELRELPRGRNEYGLVHFDFNEGNYHIDYNTGKINVFDFDNSRYCWYMFDLAALWLNGQGWLYGIDKSDTEHRHAVINAYFNEILRGYRSETDISDGMLAKLPLFINTALIEGVVDCFECARRAGEKVDFEDIKEDVNALVNRLDHGGII